VTIAFVDGKLTADDGTIERLSALAAEDAAELDGPPKPLVVRVAPPAGDREIEALLTGLMATVYVEAQRSLEEARRATVPGAPIEMRSVSVHEACRLSKAFAMLTVALARHKNKTQRLVIEHRHEHRRICEAGK
jgi:hypothetical protein